MATPPPPSSSASDPVAAAPIIAGVNPSKPYPQIFSPTAAASGAEPLIGKPLNPPPPGPPSQAVVFSIPRGIPFRPRPPIADQTVTVAGSAGYVRGSGQQTPLVAFATGQGRGPFMFPADQTGQRPPPASAVHMMRPPQPQAPFVIPRQARSAAPGAAATGAPKSAPINAGPPKAGSFPAASPNPELSNCKERDKSNEDTVVTIQGRKVRIVDGGSDSLYALCRSWVRNGVPQEPQTTFGNGMKVLPRPLPTSTFELDTDMSRSEGDNEVGDSGKQEHVGTGDHLSTDDLLQQHIKRAKRVRAELQKERLMRIDRCKQRLALLLPVPSELGKNLGHNDN
ncbi:leucine-rich repeat extensin-like protein 5 [Dioscorea cayenensis subsp. rotundata]|uniref:Leucine-rich repeat extensin-like protein 5 n=1 Tax=Dioscorea cayennensis subsp. rotundata TaxID=55577 RepID=A0AB40D206_DIOCR|nr:leucine-rich repeat extensin-like protein 5 [Dioscorea cayenensis subsp. rotundata]